MKIAIISDVHANLPALQVALDKINHEGVDLLVHLGDAIAIGPFPAECLDILINLKNTQLIMGNHDAYFAHGLPTPRPKWMTEGEVMHQNWTHAQIDPSLRQHVAQWPYACHHTFDGVLVSFLHYALDETSRDFISFIQNPTPRKLDAAFSSCAPDLSNVIFYGHNHSFSDIDGRPRYINPGSLGCAPKNFARYTIMEVVRGQLKIDHRCEYYEDDELLTAFEKRRVPEREFIYKAFFGGRF